MISDSLPTDLITEILSRLPAKSLARFRSVSKQWASIIDHSQFKHLFLTKSSSHPRLTFAIEEKGLWSIFSSPQQHLIPHDDKASSSSSSLVIFRRGDRQFACGYASGLVYFYGMITGLEDKDEAPVVCNLKTGRYETLPWILRYKSLCELINYNGKLGVVYYDDLSEDAVELRVWVLEDVEKQEWSKYAYGLKGDKLFPSYVSVVGVISTGEIVLSMADYTSGQPFYVYYFNSEGNTIRRFEIQGFEDLAK
ncbi:hypothetical protein DY000_02005087 [Brassica cretica]|uniref:F-box domain-containing protein n=1 Tax=Brassica cretica TaxID=69181 RepID=A0ABQ7C7Z3_BRACR|nr:hypothetical protein DY000_02005087 [Brassica cretica]